MTFEEWWAKQTANFDPEEIGLMQLARVTWHASQDVEREACAKVCEARVGKWGEHLSDSINRHLDAESNACANDIRMRSNASGKPATEAAKPL